MGNALYRKDGNSLVRVRNLRHKDGASLVRDKGVYLKTTVTTPPSDYQKWTGYPDSPFPTSVYPYQVIKIDPGSVYRLYLMDTNGYYIEYKYRAYWLTCGVATSFGAYYFNGSSWVYFGSGGMNPGEFIGGYLAIGGSFNPAYVPERNVDIYTDSSLGTVMLSKTTTPEQDGVESSIIVASRINT